ncbi:MAG: hypothetical protein NVSMB16_07850 [Acidimicrobiales bacterium]
MLVVTTWIRTNTHPGGRALRDARRFALAAARHGLDPTRVAPASLTPVDA